MPDHDRRYDLPAADEVAVILPDDERSHEGRDIILHRRDTGLIRISDRHPAYAPLQYVLLFSHGEPGWRDGLRQKAAEGGQGRGMEGRRQP